MGIKRGCLGLVKFRPRRRFAFSVGKGLALLSGQEGKAGRLTYDGLKFAGTGNDDEEDRGPLKLPHLAYDLCGRLPRN